MEEIANELPSFSHMVLCSAGDGKETYFWEDKWVELDPFSLHFFSEDKWVEIDPFALHFFVHNA